MPLLSQLCDATSYSPLVGGGPLAVVLCSSHEEAGHVALLVNSLLDAIGVNLRVSVTRSGPGGSPGRYNLTIQSMIEFPSKMIQFNF